MLNGAKLAFRSSFDFAQDRLRREAAKSKHRIGS